MKRYFHIPACRVAFRRKGVVLIIVLWISLGLSTMALYFGHAMMLEYRASANAVAGIEAEHTIQGALRYVMYTLKNMEEKGHTPYIDEYLNKEVFVGEGTFWLLGRNNGFAVDDAPVFGLVDEASKLNLNQATLEMLEKLPGMTIELAAAIIDWRDSDSEMTEGGAETDTYMRRDPSYLCKDGNFETVEELRLVAGADMDILYGRDTNSNGVLDPWEEIEEGEGAFGGGFGNYQMDLGILDYLTVHSREPTTGPDGSDQVNVNDDEQSDQLDELLAEVFDEERANEISGPLTTEGSLEDSNTSPSLLAVFIRSQMTEVEFELIADEITFTDKSVLPGLVNVNVASRDVLACLPGIGDEYADKLVAYREGKTDELRSVAWVMHVFAEDMESAMAAGPYITTRSYQYSVDVAAVGRDGRGFRRSLFIVDVSEEEPIVLYQRDRSRFGWPLGYDVREDLAFIKEEKTRDFLN